MDWPALYCAAVKAAAEMDTLREENIVLRERLDAALFVIRELSADRE